MTDAPTKPVLLTGASGNLGRMLTKALAAEGWTLRLTDITPFPDPIPAGAAFTRADLNDGVTILRLAEGCGAVVHLGGVSVERPFEEVLAKLRHIAAVDDDQVGLQLSEFPPDRAVQLCLVQRRHRERRNRLQLATRNARRALP